MSSQIDVLISQIDVRSMTSLSNDYTNTILQLSEKNSKKEPAVVMVSVSVAWIASRS